MPHLIESAEKRAKESGNDAKNGLAYLHRIHFRFGMPHAHHQHKDGKLSAHPGLVCHPRPISTSHPLSSLSLVLSGVVYRMRVGWTRSLNPQRESEGKKSINGINKATKSHKTLRSLFSLLFFLRLVLRTFPLYASHIGGWGKKDGNREHAHHHWRIAGKKITFDCGDKASAIAKWKFE